MKNISIPSYKDIKLFMEHSFCKEDMLKQLDKNIILADKNKLENRYNFELQDVSDRDLSEIFVR